MTSSKALKSCFNYGSGCGLALIFLFAFVMARPAVAGSNTISDDNRAECKIEGDDIGKNNAEVTFNGVTVTFTNWVKKDGEDNEYIGFDLSVEATFQVKSGTDLSTWTGTTWKNPYGTGGPDVKAISNVDFCDFKENPNTVRMRTVDLELEKSSDGPADGAITYTSRSRTMMPTQPWMPRT
jgi:hypothetical protein